MSLVLDASFALTWCFDEEATARTKSTLAALRSDFAMVPAIWPLEIANGLITAERRGRVTPVVRDGFVALLQDIDIRVEPSDVALAFSELMPLARHEGLTTYDASYLELATRRSLPLATLDAAMAAAARRIGVDVIEG